jgi:hypothetical protein
MYISLHVKYPLLSPDFNVTGIFSTDFSENTQISNFMNTRPVRAELFQANRRTDMAKLIVAFRNFANAPKIVTMHINFNAKTVADSMPR